MRVYLNMSISSSVVASRAEEVARASADLINTVFSPLIVPLQRGFVYLTLTPSAVLEVGGLLWLSTSTFPNRTSLMSCVY